MKIKFPTEIQKLMDLLDTPEKIQEYIDQKIEYDPYREDRTLVEIIRDGKGECYSGSLFALAGLMNIGYEETGLLLLSPYEDEEHILALYKKNDKWGAVAQSKFLGLKSREPIYLNIHDLAVSYREFYYSFDGYYSLRGYSDVFDTKAYQNNWFSDTETVVKMEKDLLNSPTYDLMGTPEKVFVSPGRYWAEIDYIPKETKIPERYLQHRPKYK